MFFIIALCVGQPQLSFTFATICSVASVLGGIAGYGIGLFAFETIGQPILNVFDPSRETFDGVKSLYSVWGFWGVLIAAITPIPYKVFTITSGVLKFDFLQFVLASVLGRSLRFFVVGSLIFWGGEPLKEWIENYFDWLAWGFLVVLILSFAILKFF